MNSNTAGPSRTSDSLWQRALDQSVSGILVYEAVRDKDGVIETFLVRLANRRAGQILGIGQEEMLGHTTSELFPYQPTTLWTDIAGVIDTGQAIQKDFFYQISRTKKELWFDLNIEPFGDGQRAVVSFTDITELKTASQALLGESILFKTLSSTVPGMCVVVVNYFQKVMFANGELPGLFVSRDADEVIGKRLVDGMIPAFQDDWKRYVSSALMGESHSFSDHWGGWRCECYVGPVRNERGDIVMAVCVFRDISEQFRQQQTLQRMNNDLQQSNRSLEQFAYVASHDLQEPLRKIKSFSSLLNERYAEYLDGTGIDMISRMQSAADRMNDLIKSLLAYARITMPGNLNERKKQDLVSIAGLLNDIQSDLEIAIDERRASIKLGVNLPVVPGDSTQLWQLFQNLITNALKFTRPDQRPEISVTGQLVRGGDVPGFPGVDHLQEYARVDVADNGIGISPQHFDTIFGLFSRLHGRQHFAGSGIGLATCRRIAENHGGTITVESEVNYGTTFHVYLPLYVPEQIIE